MTAQDIESLVSKGEGLSLSDLRPARLRRPEADQYARLYGGADPVFEDGDVFRVSVSIPGTFDGRNAPVPVETSASDGINGGTNGGITGGTNGEIHFCIKMHAGIKVEELEAKTGKRRRTIERTLSALAKSDAIEYCGSKKTGGYYAIGPSPSPVGGAGAASRK